NTLIAFAAKAGSTAADGDDKNSPFTAALLRYLPRPGLDLRKAFGFVRDDVLRVTHNRQEPFIYGSLGGDDVALVPAPSQPVIDPNAAAKNDYALAFQINVVSAWDSFIKKYPSGFYSDLAKAQRDKLIAVQAAAAKNDYALAFQINVVSAWDSFIKKYPSGFYSDLAKAQRDKLIAVQAAA